MSNEIFQKKFEKIFNAANEVIDITPLNYFQISETSVNQDELQQDLVKYLTLFAIKTRYIEGEPQVYIDKRIKKESKSNKKIKKEPLIEKQQISSIYKRWLNDIKPYIPSKKRDKTSKATIIQDEYEEENNEAIKLDETLDLNNKMKKVRLKLSYMPTASELSLSIKKNEYKKRNIFPKRSFYIYPYCFILQAILIDHINNDPYTRFSINDANISWKSNYASFLDIFHQDLSGLKCPSIFFPETDKKRSEIYYNNIDDHINKLKINLYICKATSKELLIFTNKKNNQSKELVETAKIIYKHWNNLKNYLAAELETFQTMVKNDVTDELKNTIRNTWDSLELSRETLIGKCFNDKNKNRLINVMSNIINKTSAAGDVTSENLKGFIDQIVHESKHALTISEKNSVDIAQNTSIISFFQLERIYALELTALIIQMYTEIRISRTLDSYLLEALSKAIMIPDVFSRKRYLSIVKSVYDQDSRYTVNDSIRPPDMEIKIGPTFDEELWVEDCSHYFQNIATNYYPVLHSLCKTEICDDTSISTEDLIAYFRSITNSDQSNATTFEEQKIIANKKYQKTINKNIGKAKTIYKNYYDLFFNEDSQKRFTQIIEANEDSDVELKEMIRKTKEKYRRTTII